MSDRPDADVIDRIRKILRRTEEAGCTEAEAQAAYRMASRLLAEHNLDMADVSGGPDDIGWVEDAAGEVGSRWTTEAAYAASVVEEFCFVKGIINTRLDYGRTIKTYKVFGKAANVEAGRWMFTSLLSAFDRLFADYRRRTACPATERRVFVVGVATGFREKMAAERRLVEAERDLSQGKSAGGTALVLLSVAEETERAFNEAHAKMKKHRGSLAPIRGSADAFASGVEAGRSLNLNRAVGGGNAKGLPNK